MLALTNGAAAVPAGLTPSAKKRAKQELKDKEEEEKENKEEAEGEE